MPRLLTPRHPCIASTCGDRRRADPVQGGLVVCCLLGRGAVFRRYGVRIEKTITLEAVNVAQGESMAVPIDEIESIRRVVGVRSIVD